MEPAVFLLHESFGYSYDEIAAVVELSSDYCRQIARRTRKHLDVAPRPKPADPTEHHRLLTRFLAAIRNGDLQGMIEVLAHDAVLYADGGGTAAASRKPVSGSEYIARFMVGVTKKFAGHFETQLATVNGLTGLLVYIDGRLQNVISAAISDGHIQQLFLVVNPDKLPSQHAA